MEYREELQERDGLQVRILPCASVMAVTLVATNGLPPNQKEMTTTALITGYSLQITERRHQILVSGGDNYQICVTLTTIIRFGEIVSVAISTSSFYVNPIFD